MALARHASLALTSLAAALLAAPADAQAPYIQRLDKAPDGSPPDGPADYASITADGNTVLFYSSASNLGATPALPTPGGLMVQDLRTGALEVVDLDSSGVRFGEPVWGWGAAMSEDGRFVAFQVHGDDPGLGDTNGAPDIYLRDRQLGTTELVSSLTTGGTGTFVWTQVAPTISADGRYVAWLGRGAGLSDVPLDGFFSFQHAYVRDRTTGTTTRLTTSLPGAQNQEAYELALSADGTTAIARVRDGFGGQEYFLRRYDVATGQATDLVTSADVAGVPFYAFSIDDTGARLLFRTYDALVPEDQDLYLDAYVLDLSTMTYDLASRPTLGAGPDVDVPAACLSPDGRYVAFVAEGDGWVPGVVSADPQVYLHDLETGLTTLASINDHAQTGASHLPAQAAIRSARSLSDRAGKVVFTSNYLNLATPLAPTALKDNYLTGIFARDLHGDGLDLDMTGLVAGASASLTVADASPGGLVLVGLSTTGQGPYASYWGPVDLSPPLHVLPLVADGAGLVQVSLPLSAALAGTPLFAKGLDVTASEPTTSFFGMIQ